jgi:hypothetical protein
MKNLILLILTLLPLFLKAQYETWMPGKALTDSSLNNRNACLYGQNAELVLFWDQELNDSTTQLCFRNIYDSGIDKEQILRFEVGLKFTNPKILNLNQYTEPPSYLVIFQTNEGKDIDLKSMKYQADGTFTDPVNLSDLPGDDINLTCSVSGTVAWENSGKIWVSQYLTASNSFSEPFAIDSAGAYSPTLESNMYLTYLKPNGDSTMVIVEYAGIFQGNWTVAERISKSFNGKSSFLSSSDASYSGGYFAMQNKIGSDPSGLMMFSSDLSLIEYRNSPSFNYSQPMLVEHKVGVKGYQSNYLLFMSDSLSQNEIFFEEPWSYPYLQNISQWPGDDRNPQIFEKWLPDYQIRLYMFWESERQGYSTIFRSYYDYTFYGGVAERQKAKSIIVNPCPFDDQTTIRFQTSGKTNVRILDLQGNEVKKLLPQNDANGWQNAVWDGTNFQGNCVPSGSYLIVAGSGNETQSRIIIKK